MNPVELAVNGARGAEVSTQKEWSGEPELSGSDTSSTSGSGTPPALFLPKEEKFDKLAQPPEDRSPISLHGTTPDKGNRKRKSDDISPGADPASVIRPSMEKELRDSPSVANESTDAPVVMEKAGGSYRSQLDRRARATQMIHDAVNDPFNNRILDALLRVCEKRKEKEMEAARKNRTIPPPPPPPANSTTSCHASHKERQLPAVPRQTMCQVHHRPLPSTSSSAADWNDAAVSPASLEGFSDDDVAPSTSTRKQSVSPLESSPSPQADEDTQSPTTGIMKTADKKKKEREQHPRIEGDADETKSHTRCNLCNTWMAKDRKQEIRYHVLHHCPVKMYKCRFCGTYSHHELGKVKRHQQNVHKMLVEDVLTFKTDLMTAIHDVYMKTCFPNYDTGKLTIGRAINFPNLQGDQIQCFVCKKRIFGSLAAYHIVDKHQNQKLYGCAAKGCRFKSVSKRALIIHHQIAHLVCYAMDYAQNLDYTEDSGMTIKSFFPEKIDLTASDCEPELLKMAEIRNPNFDKDTLLKTVLAEQDGFMEYLKLPLTLEIFCMICHSNGRQFRLTHTYDTILHMKFHASGCEKQWKCPVANCSFSSHYKIDVDVHLFDEHEDGDEFAINRWHVLLPIFRHVYRQCFPLLPMPMTCNIPDDRAEPIGIKGEVDL